MEALEYRVVDKSDWARGEWDGEPDKRQWRDEATGLPCLIVRGPAGALCGYVGVPDGHPFHGKDYGECVKGSDCNQRTEEKTWCDHSPESVLEAHGGITFAHGCAEITREKWEKWREGMAARKKEAAQYPRGDAARDLKEWAACIDDYEAWVERKHARTIGHVPAPGEPDNVWWFGFDCAHAGDFSPSFDKISRLGDPTGWGSNNEYRNVAYVEAQCRELAGQLAALA